jgi:hypothetical protein
MTQGVNVVNVGVSELQCAGNYCMFECNDVVFHTVRFASENEARV